MLTQLIVCFYFQILSYFLFSFVDFLRTCNTYRNIVITTITFIIT